MPRDGESAARVVLALAVFVDAIAIAVIAIGTRMEPMSAEPIVSALALGLLVAAIGAAILLDLTPHAIGLARGMALVLIFLLICIAIFYLLAIGMQSGGGRPVGAGLIALFAAALMVQVTILVTAGHVDRQSFLVSLGSAVGYAFLFWFTCAVILMVIGFVLDFA